MTTGPDDFLRTLEAWAAERKTARPDRKPGLGVISVGENPIDLEPLRRACAIHQVYLEEYLLPAGLGMEDIRALGAELSARVDLDRVVFWLPGMDKSDSKVFLEESFS